MNQICGILPGCQVQVELVPEVNCGLIKRLKAKGAKLGAFDFTMTAQH